MFFARNKKTLLLVSFFSWCTLHALDVCTTNDSADIISSRKICMRVNFNQAERALYKDSLCISVDVPGIVLTGWRALARVDLHYVPLFKRAKRLFSQSFNLELLIDFETNDRDKQVEIVQTAALSFSCLMLMANDKNCAVNLVIPIAGTGTLSALGLTTTVNTLQQSSEITPTIFSYQNSCDFFNKSKKNIYKNHIDELLIVDRCKDLWRRCYNGVTDFFSSISFLHWYLGCWIIFLLLFLRRFFMRMRVLLPLSISLFIEIEIFSGICVIFGTLFLLRNTLELYKYYGYCGLFCLPVAVYYAWGSNDTLLDRFKVLLGFCFACAAIPLLVKAYIIKNVMVLLQLVR